MDIIVLNHQSNVAGGQENYSIFSGSHGSVELGYSLTDNQPVGLISTDTNFGSFASLNTNISLNTQGQLAGYVGVSASW